MVDSADELQEPWIDGKRTIGVTAGASAPEILVSAVIERLRTMGAQEVREVQGVVERTVFPLPKGLGGITAAKAPELGPQTA